MKVSVIIPCYNAEHTIAQTLQSVFDQTHKDVELIVINDGSTDDSASVLDQYSKCMTVVHGPNRGVSHARNEGVSRATGDAIQFLDSDDILTPDAIGHRVALMTEHSADVVYSDWQRFTQSENGVMNRGEVVKRSFEDVHSNAEIACATDFWAPPVALLYSRSIVNRIGGWNTDLPVIQDARYLFDACYQGAKLVRCAQVTALYREGDEGSLSRRNHCAFVTDVYENARQIESLWETKGEELSTGSLHATTLAGLYDYTARNLFVSGDSVRFPDAARRSAKFSESGRMTHYVRWSYRLSQVIGFRLAKPLMRLLSALNKKSAT